MQAAHSLSGRFAVVVMLGILALNDKSDCQV